jgi:tRNA-specific 2-thiouridylase
MISRAKKIAVGMSGGVDSTMAAFMLKKKGYEVVGLTMQIWGGGPAKGVKKSGCYGPGEAEDISAAEEACRRIGMPHHVIDLKKEYQENVISYFREEYKKGKTPNPCVVCNSKIKFNLLLEKAFRSGIDFDYFATGHYARVSFDKEKDLYLLKRGVDRSKDQSYFLYKLKQPQLKRIMFPLGGKKKSDVKDFARKNGFADYADKEESQNFVECDDYFSLLPEGKPGHIVDYKGNVLGEHEGIERYTVGQRRNLKVGGLKEPYYVLKIDSRKNTIIIGPKEFAYGDEAEIKDINWIVRPGKRRMKAKIRYGAPLAACSFSEQGKKKVLLNFDKPQFAITPGQSAVFYDGDIVLGGGVIA